MVTQDEVKVIFKLQAFLFTNTWQNEDMQNEGIAFYETQVQNWWVFSPLSCFTPTNILISKNIDSLQAVRTDKIISF